MKDVDPVAEIRAWRDEFARIHGYDLKRISAAIHESASRFADRFVFIDPQAPAIETSPASLGNENPVPLKTPSFVDTPHLSTELETSAV